MRRRRGAFARLAVAWALAASASPAVRTDDGAPRARNATAAAASLGASFHVELADGRLSASVATLLPAARSVLVVDVEDVIRDFAREGRYDVLYGVRGGAAARALWRAGAASFLLGNGSALPLAEFAADVVVVDAGARFARALAGDAKFDFFVECARVVAPDGLLVVLNQPPGFGRGVGALLGDPATLFADVCTPPGGPGRVCDRGGPRHSSKRCVPLEAVASRFRDYGNVYRRTAGAAAAPLRGACCVGRPGSCSKCPRFHAVPARFETIAAAGRAGAVARAASVSAGRVARWDVAGVLRGYDRNAWANKYARSPVTAGAWRDNYVGVGGALPDKKEWLESFSREIARGHVRTILDAGAGTCSLDAHLRKHGLRSAVRLLSFGFYDCSMARVCGERGSLILDWTWLDPLPFCAACTFDLVFQAEGMHHVTETNLGADHADALCGADRAPAAGARRLRGRARAGHHREQRDAYEQPGDVVAATGSLACAQALWRASFDHFDRHVACGGVLYVSDLLGPVFPDGEGGRCWSDFGVRWAKAKKYATVAPVPGAPCTQHFPTLHVKKVCR